MPFKPIETPSSPLLPGTLGPSQGSVPAGFDRYFSVACRQPDTYELSDDGTVVPLTPLWVPPPPPTLIDWVLPPDCVAMLPPPLQACCDQLRQWRLRKGETNRLTLPEWGITILATRSALTSSISVVLFVPRHELALYRQGAKQINDRHTGVVIDIREGLLNPFHSSPYQGFGHDHT